MNDIDDFIEHVIANGGCELIGAAECCHNCTECYRKKEINKDVDLSKMRKDN